MQSKSSQDLLPRGDKERSARRTTELPCRLSSRRLMHFKCTYHTEQETCPASAARHVSASGVPAAGAGAVRGKLTCRVLQKLLRQVRCCPAAW